MKFSRLFHVLAILTLPLTALAQEDTARHRAVYAEINAAEASLRKVAALHKEDVTEFALTGWFDGDEVKKIVAKNGDDGDGVDEYYLENEKPLFVFSTWHLNGEGGKPDAKIEERQYFKDGKVFKSLTTAKPAPVLAAGDYQSATARLAGNCTAFVAALKKAKPAAKAAPAGQVAEGTFTGIEQGDYAHWNMKGKGGEELSFFLLKTDAALDKVIDNPKPYLGKTCRVTWKKSTENIPEAGGKIEIEQVLSVEWVGKK